MSENDVICDAKSEVGHRVAIDLSPNTEIIVNVGKDTVRVGFSQNRMLRDLVRYAQENGVSDSEGVFENISFDFKGGKSCVLEGMRVDTKSLYAGYLYKKDDDKSIDHVFFNAELIIGELSKKIADMRYEEKHMAIEQMLDSIWRHEREHIVQLMQPEFPKKSRNDAIARGVMIFLGLAATSTPLFIPGIDDMTRRQVLFGMMTVWAVASKYATERFDVAEREAYEKEKSKHWESETSLFDVNFESVSRPY